MKDVQELDVKTLSTTFTVSKEKLEAIESSIETTSNAYIIQLVNMSSKCVTLAMTRKIGGSDADWKLTSIPQVCNNCQTSYQSCADSGKYSPIMTTECTSDPFELFVGYSASDDTVQGAVFDIEPNCQYAGGIIGISD